MFLPYLNTRIMMQKITNFIYDYEVYANNVINYNYNII